MQDNVSSGEVSATGIWTKLTPDNRNLVGALTAAHAGEGRIELKFHIRGMR